MGSDETIPFLPPVRSRDVSSDPHLQEHLTDQGVQRPRVKAMFRRVPVQAPDVPSGGTGGGGKQPTQRGQDTCETCHA